MTNHWSGSTAGRALYTQVQPLHSSPVWPFQPLPFPILLGLAHLPLSPLAFSSSTPKTVMCPLVLLRVVRCTELWAKINLAGEVYPSEASVCAKGWVKSLSRSLGSQLAKGRTWKRPFLCGLIIGKNRHMSAAGTFANQPSPQVVSFSSLSQHCYLVGQNSPLACLGGSFISSSLLGLRIWEQCELVAFSSELLWPVRRCLPATLDFD